MENKYEMMKLMGEDVAVPELRVFIPREARKKGLLRRLLRVMK